MSLIERYIQQVERRLPARIRDDVAAELRSSLEDALEDRRAAEPERKRDEEELERELLRDYGPPDRMANSYLSDEDVLVGPRLYPAFLTALKVVLILAAALLLLGLLGTALRAGAFAATPVLGLLLRLPLLALLLLGLLTLVFALAERGSRPHWRPIPDSGGGWDPEALPPSESDHSVSRTGALARIGLYGLLLLFLGTVPAFRLFSGGTPPAPFLFGPWMGALALWASLALLFQFVLLGVGRWQTWSLWTDIALHALVALLLLDLAASPQAIAISPAWNPLLGGPAAFPAMPAASIALRLLLALLALLSVAVIVRQGRRLTRGGGSR